MTMQDQFNTELEKLGTAVTDMRTEVDMQLEQMSAVLDQLAANKPITQAQIDKLKAARNSIETSTGALRADNAPGEPLPPSPGPA